jgi:hypothetical protein
MGGYLPSVRRPLVLLAVMLCAAAAPADAATVQGRVLGQPHVDHGRATVPVMPAGGSAPLYVTVPASSGFRTRSHGRTRASHLRLGDVVSARAVSLRSGRRAQARYVRLDRRSSAPAFADLDARAAAAAKGARQAQDEIARIASEEQNGPQDPSTLRTYLLAVRTNLNYLIADLRDQARGIDTAVRDLRASSPASADPLLDRLARAADDARASATKLEDAVAGLDEFINSIGDRGTPLAAGATDTVSQLVQTVVDVLGGLTGGATPSVPNPLDGLPVPPLG